MVRFGISLYSVSRAIRGGQLTVEDAIQWIADQGAEHVEIVPAGFSLEQEPELIEVIRKKAEEAGIAISNYAVGANFITDTEEAYEEAVRKVIRHVDIAAELGVKRMRHDVASRPLDQIGIAQFERDLDRMVEACRRVADYASQYGITTSVENHGYYVQASDRVQRLVLAVDRPNFRTTLDVGNFMCADEDPVTAVQKNIGLASMVHLKDFYRRPSYRIPGEGWFQSASGNHLRGAIVGHGDIDLPEVIRVIKRSGYDGDISIEFEGLEDCLQGTKIGLANARRMWDEA
ncbi:sugar phosphate isomerase/epimerase family protein [Paenibacillus thermoaerophilus]|uniref:Sugar phosphate isomerase/epimerase family protein n=1 Tax=Paenibacillus thermoaerophilus TaxID=1215385 RepID=A0ABW2V249_9BACL|nr:sugar phosphate isomerase/epimerase family protein [Paenibacillus thermoaerophilus]TMV11144.1 sugar phosphate isomerase/epimerase [Paenibacillus thermoaerophilus]